MRQALFLRSMFLVSCSFSVVPLPGCGGNAVVDPVGGGAGGASNGGSSTGLTGGTPSTGGQGGQGGEGGDAVGGQSPIDPCSEEALGGPCDAPLRRCSLEPIEGIPCCFIAKVCEGGVVEWPVVCDDSCAQNCELVTNPMHCGLLSWCTWGGNDGCLSLPG